MGRFIGRTEDLKFLEDFYRESRFRAVALVGRRRIGKTRLIEEFIKDKDHFYVQFLESSAPINLLYLESCVEKQFGKKYKFGHFIDFFRALTDLIKGKRYVIVFDEYPFISSKDDSFSSLLQNLIDHDIGDSMVILSGSSVSMVDQEILGSTRPLFGRVHRYLLGPMSISECKEFHPGMSDADQMRMYLTFGGVPMYYDTPSMDSYSEYIEKHVLNENSLFSQEGESMIRRELPHSEEYNEILDAMVNRMDTIPEMVNVTGMDRLTIRHHLIQLMDLGLVERMHPMAGAKIRPERYRIKDRMLAFYYHVIRRHVTSYSSFGRDYESIKNDIQTFHGRMFEQQCADHVKSLYPVKEIGMWYGNIPLKDIDGKLMKDGSGKVVTEATDIDLVAFVMIDGSMVELYGECKFTAEPVGFREMNKLRARMSQAHVGANSKMIFFSRSGFFEDFKDYAQTNGILLVDLDDMFN